MTSAPDMQKSAGDIAGNLAAVRKRMAAAAKVAGRRPEEIELVAVSKTHPAAPIAEAIAAGQTVFGENRVQEAQGKFPPLKADHPAISLHLVGPLQTNKVRDSVGLFDVFQSLDRPKLAHSLAKELARAGRRPEIFIQVNTGEEPQKSGVLPKGLPDLFRLSRDELGLNVVGLMCIPPFDEDPVPHFAFLGELADRHGLTKLSMGMSSDFESAIRLGATHVRVGTGVFGARQVY